MCVLFIVSCGPRSQQIQENHAENCPFNFTAISTNEVEITYQIDDIEQFAIISANENTLEIRWRSPLQRTEQFVCHSEGLFLVRVEEENTQIEFSPAILVLPSTSTAGEQEGTVLLNENGILNNFFYSHAWQSRILPQNSLSSEESLGLEGDFSQVESALVIHNETHRYTWQTRTNWARSFGLLLPLNRTQIFENPEGVTTRREQATDLHWK